ncbi:MAG: helix-turn-helix domain-containing protein [Candidatus Thiodiazotropha sp.]|jgi:transcriptional regulator with XRE-family HTH domain
MSMSQSPAEIIRNARIKLQLNQKDFANSIKKTQSSVSRYESGDVPPPSQVIMHCMNILNKSPSNNSVGDLIDKLSLLKGDEHSKLIEALNVLLDGYFSHH